MNNQVFVFLGAFAANLFVLGIINLLRIHLKAFSQLKRKISKSRFTPLIKIHEEFGYEVLSHDEGIMNEIFNECGC